MAEDVKVEKKTHAARMCSGEPNGMYRTDAHAFADNIKDAHYFELFNPIWNEVM